MVESMRGTALDISNRRTTSTQLTLADGLLPVAQYRGVCPASWSIDVIRLVRMPVKMLVPSSGAG